MSLPITFHRAASAEFSEASVWYESKRIGLALEFMAEIDRCASLVAEHPLQLPLFAKTFDVRCQSLSIAFILCGGSSHCCLGGISWQQRSFNLAG